MEAAEYGIQQQDALEVVYSILRNDMWIVLTSTTAHVKAALDLWKSNTSDLSSHEFGPTVLCGVFQHRSEDPGQACLFISDTRSQLQCRPYFSFFTCCI